MTPAAAAVKKSTDLVGRDADLEVFGVAELLGVGHGEEPDLVESIGGVTDQLAQKDVLVLVERVDDDVHQPVHLPRHVFAHARLC